MSKLNRLIEKNQITELQKSKGYIKIRMGSCKNENKECMRL